MIISPLCPVICSKFLYIPSILYFSLTFIFCFLLSLSVVLLSHISEELFLCFSSLFYHFISKAFGNLGSCCLFSPLISYPSTLLHLFIFLTINPSPFGYVYVFCQYSLFVMVGACYFLQLFCTYLKLFFLLFFHSFN